VADDVTDKQAGPLIGQSDDVVPVATDLEPEVSGAVGDIDRQSGNGVDAPEHRALQFDDDLVLALGQTPLDRYVDQDDHHAVGPHAHRQQLQTIVAAKA
jgi:hypothetical protein